MTKDELREKANDLPLQPGVYLMMDKTGKVIYVGKAKKLKNRVSQYFQDSAAHSVKTRQMVSQVDHFDTIFVTSEFEALVLENSLIKRHMPRYNILLKDDKGYPFVRLDSGGYPRFTLVNRTADDGAKYYGPFGGRHETRLALDAVCAALRLPTCSRRFPRDIGKERPCLNFHMGRCDGFCRPDMPEAEYNRRMEQACQLLEGRSKQLLRDMTAEMEADAEALRFEQAAQLRDRIQAIGALGKKQTVIAGLCADTDVWGVFRGAGKSGYAVLHMENGNLVGRETELLTSPMEETAAELLAAITAQYYLPRAILPHEILLCVDTGDCEELSEALTQRAGRKVWVHVPQRGEKSTLADMAIRNAQEEVQRATTVEEKTAYTLEVLQKIYISDISKVAVGRSKYTASLDENGEIIDDVIVMHMAEGVYWVSDLYGPRLLPWIEQHKGEADIHAKIITYDWDMYAVQGPDSLKAMNAMLDAPVDDLKRFGICERKLGDIPVYIHRSGFTGENGYEIYSAFDKSAEIHDLALKAVESVGGRELQTLEVYVRSIPMEKGFALKQDFKHLSPYECGLGWAVAADKDFIGKEAALARKEHPKYRMVGLEFSRESTEDISIWERVYWYGVEVGRCAQTIYGYTVDKNIGFATVRADVPDGAELTVGCNESPAVVVNKVFC